MISIVNQAAAFTPSGNPIIYQIDSDNSNLVYFAIKLIDNDSNAVINLLNIFPTPAYPNGSYIDLSRLLSNTVNYELYTDLYSLVAPMTRPVRSYKLQITEMVFNIVTGDVEAGEVYNTPTANFVWEAELDRSVFNFYNDEDFVLSTTAKGTFLTTKPNFSKVNNISTEYLYFLHDGSYTNYKLKIATYNNAKQVIATKTNVIDGLSVYKMFRINVSPKSMLRSLAIDFTNVAYYTVAITDTNNIVRSDVRTYLYTGTECNKE